MATQLVVSTIFKAKDQVTAAVKRMTTSVTTFSKKAVAGFRQIQRAESKLRKGISKSIGKLGKLGSAFSAFVLAKVATDAVLNFEEGLVGVGKTTGIANAELKDLGLKIIDASNKLRTVKTQKLLELAEAAGQLSVKGTKYILKFSSTLAKLEKASDIEGEEGAKSIARLLTITKE